jgi:hypothetical protein
MTSYLKQYLALTGDKRIKRTADEIDRGLDAESAAKERMAEYEQLIATQGEKPKAKPKKKITKRLGDKGKFSINFKPDQGSDPDFLATLTGKSFEIVLDDKWYSWFQTRLEYPYEGNAQMLMEHIIQLGMDEVVTTLKTPEELEEHIKLTDFSTVKK